MVSLEYGPSVLFAVSVPGGTAFGDARRSGCHGRLNGLNGKEKSPLGSESGGGFLPLVKADTMERVRR